MAMQYTTEQSDGAETITLARDMTISSAAELKEVLNNALSGSDRIMLNLEQVTEVDLSCLQLLCSAHRTAKKREKSFTRTGDCPETLKIIAEHAGYLRHTGCVGGCLWAGIYKLGQ